jgi:Ser/Thr protein kinase RdoA (MazF antagonist)
MEKHIKERFTPSILAAALQRFGVGEDDINPLDGFESFIYEFIRDGGAYILRIGHSLRRSEAMIAGEVDWINYLADGGAGVSRAILSQRGNLVEALPDGHDDHFLATAFERAPGKPPWEAGWNPERYRNYGALLGRAHALSQDYLPRSSIAFRPQWDDPLMLDAEANLPVSEELVLGKFLAVVDHLRSLPLTRDWYGMVHFDAHQGNFFMTDEGQITLFDFDDCHYSWYANDIAIALFYFIMGADDPAAYTHTFMRDFIAGYQTENNFNPAWLPEIPYFLKLREIDLYAIIHRDFDVENIDDPWCARYMQGRKERIEADVPYYEMDFSELTPYIV